MSAIRPPLALLAALALVACSSPDYGRPLPPGSAALLLVPEAEWPDLRPGFASRASLAQAVDRSLEWFDRPGSTQRFPIEGVDHVRARASVARFAELLGAARTAQELVDGLHREFDLYRSAGWDGRGGGTLFTAYCTPIVDGSLSPTPLHSWPLYALPEDLAKAPDGTILGRRAADGSLSPYPTRAEIEGRRLLSGQGLELVWLNDPLDAFIAHVNGSVTVRLPDGSLTGFGYAGKNGREYRSLRAALVEAGEIPADASGLDALREWADRARPGTLRRFLWENPSYVFFTPREGPPHGSLNVPVTARHSLATDKSLFPPGGVVFLDAELPDGPWRRFLMDQDTGGAIRTAGRADIYLGTGPEAEALAGRTVSPGQMYYLFLKPERVPAATE